MDDFNALEKALLDEPPQWMVDGEGWLVLNPAWREHLWAQFQAEADHVRLVGREWSTSRAVDSANRRLAEARSDEAARMHERFLVERTARAVVRELTSALPWTKEGGLPPPPPPPDRMKTPGPRSVDVTHLGCDTTCARSPATTCRPPAQTRRPHVESWARGLAGVLRRWADWLAPMAE